MNEAETLWRWDYALVFLQKVRGKAGWPLKALPGFAAAR